MNAIIDTDSPPSETPLTNWRPPGWIVGDPDEPFVPENIEDLYAMYAGKGYYTAGGCLTDKALALGDEDRGEIEAVIRNRRLLRDAWNTPGVVWRLAAALIGRPFKVDPFWNQGARELPDLAVRLDGLGPLTDGMMTVGRARELAATHDDATLRTRLELRLNMLGAVPPEFPLNWRQELDRGEAPAAANGPHSCTAKWLRCSAAYGREEFSAAFVPDNGDAWFQRIAMTAALVVRLGRVNCHAPPGVQSSSPRGASSLCVWVPEHVRTEATELHARLLATKHKGKQAELTAQLDALLPEPTRRVLLGGHSISVPLWERPKAGTQYAVVQRGDLLDGDASVVDLGLVT